MKPKIIGIGELLWDMLPSPSSARMGGAPANFTCHANALGADAAVIMGLLQRWPLQTIFRTANEIAAQVCSCEGAVPPLPPALRDRFQWNGWKRLIVPVNAIGRPASWEPTAD